MLDAPQVARAITRIAQGTDTRPPAYHAIQHYRRTDGTRSGTKTFWNISADCLDPVYREMYGRPFRDRDFGIRQPVAMEVFARCRKCEHCLEQRARLWRGRVLGEMRKTIREERRTWFVTLTLNPAARTMFKMKAWKRFNDGGKAPKPGTKGRISLEYSQLSANERFGLVHSEISQEITRWFKRLRKQAGVKFRYLVIAEAHKAEDDPTKRNAGKRKATGGVFPHYHILIHEVSGRLTERVIRDQWRGKGNGFCEAKLVRGGPEEQLYLCKYLSKDNRARVRASIGYGRDEIDASNARGAKASEAKREEKRTAPLNANPPDLSLETAHVRRTGETHGLPIIRLSGRSAARGLSKPAAASYLTVQAAPAGDVPSTGTPSQVEPCADSLSAAHPDKRAWTQSGATVAGTSSAAATRSYQYH